MRAARPARGAGARGDGDRRDAHQARAGGRSSARSRCGSRADARPARAGRAQPDLERGEVLARRRHGSSARRAHRRAPSAFTCATRASGWPEETLDQLFTKFFRADNDRDAADRGDRPRPGARPRDRAGARRHRGGAQRAREGLRVHARAARDGASGLGRPCPEGTTASTRRPRTVRDEAFDRRVPTGNRSSWEVPLPGCLRRGGDAEHEPTAIPPLRTDPRLQP